MAWGKVGSKTLTSSADIITITGTTPSKFNTILNHIIKVTGSLNLFIKVGNGSIDSGSNYVERYAANGNADSSGTSLTHLGGVTAGTVNDTMVVGYVCNIASEEKLFIIWSMHSGGVGAGSNPKRQERVGKWVNTNDQFDQISADNAGAAGDYDTGSIQTILGSDTTPAAAVPAISGGLQDNSLFIEKDTAKRYWFSPQTVDTEEAFSFTTTDTVNALWGNRIYGMKLLSGHSGLNKYIKKIKTYHPTNPTGSRLTTGTLYHVILDSSGTEIARSAGVSASSVSNNTYAETTLSSPVELLENYTVGVTISTGSGSSYLGTSVNNNSSSPTNTTRYYKDESGTVTTSTSETIIMVFDSDPATGISTPSIWTIGYIPPIIARGVFAGGYNGSNVDVIDYITISTLGNATDFGDMFEVRRAYAGLGNDTRGLWAGGYAGSLTNTISYITIATPSNATDFGNLTHSTASGVVGAGNDTRGIFAGGESPKQGIIDYVTIATAGNATDFGDLTSNRKGGGVTSDKTKAVFLGGESGETTIDYVTIDTPANATAWGTLTAGSYAGHSGTISDGTTGIFAIGGSSASGSYNNTIVYKTIATNANALDFGDLTSGRGDGGQAGDSTRGIFAGGKTTGGSSNVTTAIDYITIATAGNATSFGSLTVARNMMAGLSDGQ